MRGRAVGARIAILLAASEGFSMSVFAFRQVDVFTEMPLKGNPLAVVLSAEGLDDAAMAALANWTNLSETTFLLPPTDPAADYRVRIFTPQRELPFAGHPTLGSCHVWLAAGGVPRGPEVVQQCVSGLVRIRSDGPRLAFAAPPLVRSGAVEPGLLSRLARGLGVSEAAILGSSWVDNGPGWVAVRLASRAAVLGLTLDLTPLDGIKLGVVGPWDAATDGEAAQFEVRGFVCGKGGFEDPVTGSLNASLAQWLIGTGIAPSRYVASQGTALGRSGRVHVTQSGDDIWIGGGVVTAIEGTLSL
jgi:PhzF family phenazine biosynthesis protein